jgi:hypothetical protein
LVPLEVTANWKTVVMLKVTKIFLFIINSVKKFTFTSNFMEQSTSCEAHSHWVGVEVHVLWKQKAHYLIHKTLLLVPIQSKINLNCIFTFQFINISFNNSSSTLRAIC